MINYCFHFGRFELIATLSLILVFTVNKYKGEREDEDKLSKLTMHSFKKKTKRISMRIGNYVGLATQVSLTKGRMSRSKC